MDKIAPSFFFFFFFFSFIKKIPQKNFKIFESGIAGPDPNSTLYCAGTNGSFFGPYCFFKTLGGSIEVTVLRIGLKQLKK